MSLDGVEMAIRSAATAFGLLPAELSSLLAVLLVGLTCGLVGSLVVGNRMAFFSDAMAHTAFAGVALAILGVVVATGKRQSAELAPYAWTVPLVTAGFGVLVGLTMEYVRGRTGLTNDTVIGVFFALSIGVGAMLLPHLPRGTDPDQLLFGTLVFMAPADLLTLAGLAAVAAGLVAAKYNAWVFASFNPSLARSRGLAVRADGYLFVVLLALVVNLSIKAVGILLINALLVVPAAAAANVAANLRQFFWLTVVTSTALAGLGYFVSTRLALPIGRGEPLEFGPGGTIVVLCVGWFFTTMAYATVRGRVSANGVRAG